MAGYIQGFASSVNFGSNGQSRNTRTQAALFQINIAMC
jgi:hypothetical protein